MQANICGLEWCGSEWGQVAGPCEHGTAAAVPQNGGNFFMRWGTISFSSVLHAVSYSDRHAVNVVVWWNVGMLVELLFVYVQLISKSRFYEVWHSAVWCMGTISVEEIYVSIVTAAESIACCGVRASARRAGNSCIVSWSSKTRTAPHNISENSILGTCPCEIFKSHAPSYMIVFILRLNVNLPSLILRSPQQIVLLFGW